MKHVLITGAGRGLGYHLARCYLRRGDTVFMGVRNTQDGPVGELRQVYGERCVPVELDVGSTASAEQALEVVAGVTGTLDILINNAAVHGETSFEPLETANLEGCLEVYSINALGPLRVVKAALPLLRGGSGVVANISSESGSIGACKREKEFDYCMSKAALNMGTRLLGNYLAKDGCTVLSIHPGWMRTDMGGPNAALDPAGVAEQIAALLDTPRSGAAAQFVDNTGSPLPW